MFGQFRIGSLVTRDSSFSSNATTDSCNGLLSTTQTSKNSDSDSAGLCWKVDGRNSAHQVSEMNETPAANHSRYSKKVPFTCSETENGCMSNEDCSKNDDSNNHFQNVSSRDENSNTNKWVWNEDKDVQNSNNWSSIDLSSTGQWDEKDHQNCDPQQELSSMFIENSQHDKDSHHINKSDLTETGENDQNSYCDEYKQSDDWKNLKDLSDSWTTGEGSSEGFLLKGPVYSPLHNVVRCIHISCMEDCYRKQTLLPSTLPNHLHHISRNHKVLWFSPYNGDPEDHNKYGNISFSMPLSRIIKRFGSQFCFFDKKCFANLIISKMLLIKHPDLACNVPVADLTESGCPLQSKAGVFQFADFCRNKKGILIRHELAIGIEVSAEDCQWLYHQCTVEANNHAKSNDYQYYGWHKGNYSKNICHQYNDYHACCPYPFSSVRCQNVLEDRFPEY